jgi:hypothetical protein
MRLLLIAPIFVALGHAAGIPTPTPTFHRDIEPILQARCQGCHRPGEAAPMSLLSFKEARPWAKSMKEAVLTGKMPPWFADPGVGHFKNDRTLPQNERETLVRWVDGGAPEGDPKDAPRPISFVDGWAAGQPDAIYEMKPFDVPANGVLDYQWVVIPLGFKEDRWIRAIELRPGVRSVVHHIVALERRAGSTWLADARPFEAVPKAPGGNETGGSDAILGEFVPGASPKTLPEGTAMLLHAGSDIVLQLHYTPNGKATTDRSRFGLFFAPAPAEKRFLSYGIGAGKYVIPPNAPDVRVTAQATFDCDVRLMYLQPHMHLRGKSFDFTAIYPDGHEELLLRVPNYDFYWQLRYELAEDRILPAGTKLVLNAVYDNSINNPRNPDPSKEVRPGEQSTDEMMVGIIHVAVDPSIGPKALMRKAPPSYVNKPN